jgi:hypothetical protein
LASFFQQYHVLNESKVVLNDAPTKWLDLGRNEMVNEAQEATENVQEERPGQLPRIMSRQMAIYYSNCAMVATTPKDISLVFGRYVPANNQQAEQTMAELYERHIYMTVEQAEELAKTLTKTLEIIKSKVK